jgi:hypothetical protein
VNAPAGGEYPDAGFKDSGRIGSASVRRKRPFIGMSKANLTSRAEKERCKWATGGARSYDVTSDGRRFLMVQQKERQPLNAAEIIFVQNWLEELNARVPVK